MAVAADDAVCRASVMSFIERANALPAERVPALYRQQLAESSDSFSRKWLVARNFVVDDAFAMFVAACEFRLERGLDDMSLFPCATALQGYDVDKLVLFSGKPPRAVPSELDFIVRSIRSCVTRCWHKCDKVCCILPVATALLTLLVQGGRPVCIERTGRIQSKRLCALCSSLSTPAHPTPLFTAHLHSVEVGRALARFNNAHRPPAASEISQVTAIMDMAGLGLHTLHPPALALLRVNGVRYLLCCRTLCPRLTPASGQADQNYYPESLHKLFVVNTPAVIAVAWRIISPWVDPRTKSKIVFLKPHETASELLKYIDEDNLPVDLGGRCACAGGCFMDSADTPPDDLQTCVAVSVQAGGKYVVTVSVAEKHTICWDFVLDAYDIAFCARVGSTIITEGISTACR
jgi:hypothetical protein